MNGLGATQKKESPGETKQNAFDAIIELISTKCMGLLPQRLGNRAQIRRKSSLGLGAVICLVSYQLIRRKASHAHERRRGERKIVLVGKYNLMRLWHEVGGLKSPLKCLTQDHTGQRPPANGSRLQRLLKCSKNEETLRYVRKFTFMFTIRKTKDNIFLNTLNILII